MYNKNTGVIWQKRKPENTSNQQLVTAFREVRMRCYIVQPSLYIPRRLQNSP